MQTNSKIIAKIKIYSVTVSPPGKKWSICLNLVKSNWSTLEMLISNLCYSMIPHVYSIKKWVDKPVKTTELLLLRSKKIIQTKFPNEVFQDMWSLRTTNGHCAKMKLYDSIEDDTSSI
jgi:hypothetical protein